MVVKNNNCVKNELKMQFESNKNTNVRKKKKTNDFSNNAIVPLYHNKAESSLINKSPGNEFYLGSDMK